MDRFRFAVALALLASGPKVQALGASELVYVPLSPCRVLDTRCVPANPPGTSCSAGTPVAAVVSGGPYSCSSGPPCPGSNPQSAPFRIQGSCGVPVGAAAVTLNLAVAGMTAGGYGRIYPADSAYVPVVSLINYRGTDGALANGAVVPLGAVAQPADPDVRLYLNQTGGGTAHVIVDVTGYFTAGIDSLLAGTGLTGGGSSGAVTLSLLGSYRLPQGCSGGQLPAWNGEAWVCQTPVSGSVALVDSGAGLTGGPITSVGTLSVAVGGITSAMIASGAVGLAQIDTSQVQARGASTCAAGSTIQTIHADGSVVCALNQMLSSGFSLATLDGAGSVGYSTSITIGADSLGLISYFDGTNGDLKVAHCSNAACTSAGLATLDGAENVGAFASVTIDADGLGLISYRDYTNLNLKVARCSDEACTSASLTTLDSAGAVGSHTSITIGADGLGLISYYDETNGDLKVAHCSDNACTSASLATLDSAGVVGFYTSITIGADGLGLISYYDSSNGDLKVAHCSNVACSSASLATLDSVGTVGWNTSITIGSDSLGLISYYDQQNQDLKVAHCSNTACSSASLATLDSAGIVGPDTSITIGADGLGLISYYDVTNGALKVAHCSNVVCSSASLATLDSAGNVGSYTSIAIGADGLGLISYFDQTNSDLKVAHCSNVLCTPYVRRR